LRLTLPHTHLIGSRSDILIPTMQIPANLKEGIDIRKTNLVSRMFRQWSGMPVSLFGASASDESVYGYIGMEDFTLFPLVRSGLRCADRLQSDKS